MLISFWLVHQTRCKGSPAPACQLTSLLHDLWLPATGVPRSGREWGGSVIINLTKLLWTQMVVGLLLLTRVIDRMAVGAHLTRYRAEACSAPNWWCWEKGDLLDSCFPKEDEIPFACLTDPCLENVPRDQGQPRRTFSEFLKDPIVQGHCNRGLPCLSGVCRNRAHFQLGRQAVVYFWRCRTAG